MSDSLHSFALEMGELAKDLEGIGQAAPLVMARALNRATTSGQTAIVKAIVDDTGMTAKFVKRTVVIDKATRTDPRAAWSVSGKRIPLVAFSARGPEPSRGKGRGVSYRLPSGRGRIPNAFIATMPNAGPESNWHKGVFVRSATPSGRSRGAWGPNLPIRQLYGPSIPHVAEKFAGVFRAAAQESFLKNLAHEIAFERSKQTGTE